MYSIVRAVGWACVLAGAAGLVWGAWLIGFEKGVIYERSH